MRIMLLVNEDIPINFFSLREKTVTGLVKTKTAVSILLI